MVGYRYKTRISGVIQISNNEKIVTPIIPHFRGGIRRRRNNLYFALSTHYLLVNTNEIIVFSHFHLGIPNGI